VLYDNEHNPLTGHADVLTGVHAMKKGAVDLLLKPVDDHILFQSNRQAVERHAAERKPMETIANQLSDPGSSLTSPRSGSTGTAIHCPLVYRDIIGLGEGSPPRSVRPCRCGERVGCWTNAGRA
jgi:hypothetical protein